MEMDCDNDRSSGAANRRSARDAADQPQHQHQHRMPPAAAAAAAAAATAGSPAPPARPQAASGEPPAPAAGDSSVLSAAVSHFHGEVGGLQAALQQLLEAAAGERQALEAAQRQLTEDRALLERERSRVAQVLADSDQVVLNVGGVRFTTTVSTLRGGEPSLFSAMFSGRHALVPSADGSIFIDRDGRHFADVLNYLRSQQLAYPPGGTDYKYLLELRAEAEYYGLAGLTKIIDRFPFNRVTVVRGLQRSSEDTWVYEDGRDEVVLRVSQPCQLLGAGLCASDSGYTAELEVTRVAEDCSEELEHLGQVSQTFARSVPPAVNELLLPDPVALAPGQFYMLSLAVRGSDSFCCEDCIETVVAGGVTVQFQCWESSNGTNETRGQFPELYIRPLR